MGKGATVDPTDQTPPTHWNYRAVRYPDGTLVIQEVYYEGGLPRAVTESGAAVIGESIGELRGVLAMMEEGLAQPVIDQSSIGQARARESEHDEQERHDGQSGPDPARPEGGPGGEGGGPVQ